MQAPAIYLGACDRVTANGCGAYAIDATVLNNGSLILDDYSARLQVTPVPACATVNGTTACTSCTMEQLHLPGACPPGAYTYTFSATDGSGQTSTAQRTVYIYYRSSSLVTFRPFAASNSLEEAQRRAADLETSIAAVAAGLSAGRSATDTLTASAPADGPYAAAVSAAAALLTFLGPTAKDVFPRSARVANATNTTNGLWVVEVVAEVFTYAPTIVHHADIQDYDVYVAALATNTTFLRAQSASKLGVSTEALATAAASTLSVRRQLRAPAEGYVAGGLLAPEAHVRVERFLAALGMPAAPAASIDLHKLMSLLNDRFMPAHGHAAMEHIGAQVGTATAQVAVAAMQAARRVLQAGNASAVGAALNASSVLLSVYTTAPLQAGAAAYSGAIQALSSVVAQQVSALVEQASVLVAHANLTLGQPQMDVEEQLASQAGSAFNLLLAASSTSKSTALLK